MARVVLPETARVLLKVVAPVTNRVPWVAILPSAPVVVAMPLIIKFEETETRVVVALTRVVNPVALVVPVTVKLPPVVILSPTVLEPKAEVITKKTEIKTTIK